MGLLNSGGEKQIKQEEKGILWYIIIIDGSMFQGREKKGTLFSWAFQSHQGTISPGVAKWGYSCMCNIHWFVGL
jgi:hypothetical protein